MMPDVPAITESLPGYDATSWVGLMAPARTPDAVVQRLARDARDALAQPVVASRMRELGADIGGG